jgi:subtilase family serine protease
VNCDNPDEEPYAVEGLSVNALASTPDNVAVGGTDFNDFTNYGQYWTSSNLPLDESAVSYIPEMTWNNSCASSVLYGLLGYSDGVEACNGVYGLRQYQYLNITGGGGGPSTTWVQQEWQSGIYGSTNYNLRMLPDVSLFSANGAFGHALVYCMSDPDTYGTPCDYSNPSDMVLNSAGGTSFAAPAMAGVQALINQATGGIGNSQMFGNMLPVLYNLAMKEYGTNGSPNTSMLQACNSSNGANIGSNCVFNNVTVGNNDEPCYAGGQDCYGGSGVVTLGVASAGGFGSLAPAWQTNSGYSMATGLGSINAANLVNAVAKFYKPFSTGYVSPYDFMGPDGYSDIALVDPVKGAEHWSVRRAWIHHWCGQ